MGEIRIRAIEPSYLDFYWGKIFPQVKAALSYANGEQNPLDVYDAIKDNVYILFVVTEGEKVLGHWTVQKVTFPRKTILDLVTVGGTRLKEWVDEGLKMTEKVGKELGCTDMYTHGRKGWIKIFKDFTPKYYIYTKVIT